jgi:hypothetical protein
MFRSFAYEKDEENGGMKWRGLLKNIEVGHPSLNMARLVCTFLLHVLILPEMSTAKYMLSFTKKNITTFTG